MAEKGQTYSTERVAKSLEQIRAAYGDIGYIGAYVNRRETPGEDHAIDIHFDITENKPWNHRSRT